MQQLSTGEILYSASDLVNFLECEHLTALDLIDLTTPLPKTMDSDEAKLIHSGTLRVVVDRLYSVIVRVLPLPDV